MKEEEIIKKVKKFAKEVYKILGAGYNETVYEEALGLEMRKAKIDYDIELNTEIMYKGEKVGIHRLDFIIERKVVVELKAAASISKGNKSQIQSYLRTLGLKKGLLINFPYPDKKEPDVEEVTQEINIFPCEECGRTIKHKGKCLACNTKAKREREKK